MRRTRVTCQPEHALAASPHQILPTESRWVKIGRTQRPTKAKVEPLENPTVGRDDEENDGGEQGESSEESSPGQNLHNGARIFRRTKSNELLVHCIPHAQVLYKHACSTVYFPVRTRCCAFCSEQVPKLKVPVC